MKSKRILALVMTVFMMLAVSPMVTLAADDDVISFSDANFEAAVRGVINKPSGDILKSDVSDVTALLISSKKISDLSGIEYFTSLQTLKCSHNLLTSLDVSGSKNLKVLDCYENQLTSLNVSNTPMLSELRCNAGSSTSKTRNQLTSLDISTSPELTLVDVADNKLTSLDVSNNKKLKKLVCSGNSLSQLNFVNLPNLFTLDIRGNEQLTSVNISDVPKLSILYCQNTNLSKIDVSGVPSLVELHCDDNKFTSLDVSANVNLEELFLHKNQLTSLDVSNNRKLKQLGYTSNKISNIDLSNNTELNYLSCGSNNVASLNLSANTKLYHLYASNNLLTGIDLSNNQGLGYVDLSNNYMASENAVTGFSKENVKQYVFNPQKTGTPSPSETGTPALPANQSLIAKPTASTVLVNGKSVAFDAYNINDNNYFKLRDLAYTLSGTEAQFEVGWDAAKNAISLASSKAYSAVGGEMEGKGSGNKTPIATTSKIYLDGKEVTFTAYNIDGNNYFKLRDVGAAFDFNVSWDGANNTIAIATGESYTAD